MNNCDVFIEHIQRGAPYVNGKVLFKGKTNRTFFFKHPVDKNNDFIISIILTYFMTKHDKSSLTVYFNMMRYVIYFVLC